MKLEQWITLGPKERHSEWIRMSKRDRSRLRSSLAYLASPLAKADKAIRDAKELLAPRSPKVSKAIGKKSWSKRVAKAEASAPELKSKLDAFLAKDQS